GQCRPRAISAASGSARTPKSARSCAPATRNIHGPKIPGPRRPPTAPAAGDFSPQRTQTARRLCGRYAANAERKKSADTNALKSGVLFFSCNFECFADLRVGGFVFLLVRR